MSDLLWFWALSYCTLSGIRTAWLSLHRGEHS